MRSRAAPSPDTPSRVLILAGDAASWTGPGEALQQAGLTLELTGDAPATLAAAEREPPDLVLLDVQQPRQDGLEACTRLRQLPGCAAIPVVLVTDPGDPQAIQRGQAVGATDFFTRPIDPVLLTHRVRSILHADRTLQELRRSERGLAHAQRIAHLGSWVWELGDDRMSWSDEIWSIFGLEPDGRAVDFARYLERLHPADRAAVHKSLQGIRHDPDAGTVDFRIVRPDHSERFVHQQAELTLDASGRPLRLSGILQDVTERVRAQEQIRFLAYYDGLTALPNRQLLREQLRQFLLLAQRQQRQVAILFLDLDRFKRINDTLGHGTGDLLLQSVAQRLIGSVRRSDSVGRQGGPDLDISVCRLGGDEFTVLLADIRDPQDAARVGQRILDLLARPFILDGTEIFITASIGLAVFPQDGEDVDTLLVSADSAMSHAKSKGGGTYQFFAQQMNRSARERLELEGSLRRALEREEFRVHYQPQLDVNTGRIIGLEALIRWHHPERGLVPPVQFIPLAEENGMIVPIGEWVLLQACRQMKQWQGQGLALHSMRVAVNLSGRQFKHQGLGESIRDVLALSALDPAFLELELTESMLMQNEEGTISTLHQLKGMGLQLSVDDFGTGYSSLAYLRRFPINTLKIDRSFVKDIAADEGARSIVEAIIRMAHSLNLRAIAEGVEDEQQLAFLRERGCDQMQGYLLSPPLPPDEVRRFLEPGFRFGRSPGTHPPERGGIVQRTQL